MPSKRRYRCYLEPATSSHKVPRQTVWSQQKKQSSAAASQTSSGEPCHDSVVREDDTGAQDDFLTMDDQPSVDAGSSGETPDDIAQGDLLTTDDQPPDDAECAGETPEATLCHEDDEVDDPDIDLSEFIAENSSIQLPGLATTRLQAMLLILTFVVTAGLPWTQVDGLLKLLNAIFGK
ncbi:hypothetical protein HPB50_011828 [Hyalomma asiaticum]|uniref:Uncharacterized protein n=1 Tax=Hyalomma asiaticum TaxID=266040 RepID=A0ACB7RZN9_HYAAI|nr:hypothetical protein HPB50_011828 [Hyalomma asiaticum]